MQYPFGDWEPDNPTTNSGVLNVAEGAIRQVGGWGPFPQLVQADGAAALSADPRGVVSVQRPDNSWAVYGATATTIEELSSTFTWNTIESGRTVTTGDDVSMLLFGKYLINTDTTDGLKAYDVVAGGTNNAVSGAPSARALMSINNVLFGLGTATNPRRFQSSDIGNHTKWSGGAADGKTLEDGGALVGGADLKNGVGVMFQDKAIRGVQFGAGAATYSISKVSDGLGCVGFRTIVPWDGMVFWWSEDGPFMLQAGTAPIAIGAEKINRWAADSIGRQNFKNLQGAIDPQRKLVLWRIDGSRILAFSWLAGGKFTILPATTTAVVRIANPAVSIDSLSGTIDGLAPTIDGLGGGSSPQIGGLNLSRKYSTFSGSSMAVTLEQRVINGGATGLIDRVTPIDDAASGTIQVGVSDRLDASLTWKQGAAKVGSGSAALRARGLNMAFRRNVDAGDAWTYINGVDYARIPGGGRR